MALLIFIPSKIVFTIEIFLILTSLIYTMKKTKEQIERDIELGKKDEDIYTGAGREVAEEEDEISDVEEGFMEGYEEDEHAAKCANCKKILKDDYIEEEFDDEILKFCSERCASKYERSH